MSLPQWKGLWDWSLKYADGTGRSRFRPEDVDPEKMKWLDEALKSYMVDFGARMRDIKSKLASDTPSASAAAAAAAAGAAGAAGKDRDQDRGGAGDEDAEAADVEEKELLLEELMDIVGSIDYARDLHKIGGVSVLLELLESPAPGLRWRAAEVVATCVANNPPVQEWFLEGGVLPKLLALAAPPQPPTCRTKALLAISGLIRHFAPGLAALRTVGGLAVVAEGVKAEDRRVARKAMTTLSYMLSQRQADCADAAVAGGPGPAGSGVLPALVAALAAGAGAGAGGEEEEAGSQEDSDFRQAALGVLLQLAGYPGTWAAVRDAPGLRPRLAALEAAHLGLPPDTREAQAEELAAVRRLAAALAAPAAPPLRPDASDHVSVAQFEASAGVEEMTINVNQPSGGKGGDGGAGAGDQGAVGGGGAAAAAAEAQGGQGAAEAAAPAAPAAPLLLGPP